MKERKKPEGSPEVELELLSMFALSRFWYRARRVMGIVPLSGCMRVRVRVGVRVRAKVRARVRVRVRSAHEGGGHSSVLGAVCLSVPYYPQTYA